VWLGQAEAGLAIEAVMTFFAQDGQVFKEVSFPEGIRCFQTSHYLCATRKSNYWCRTISHMTEVHAAFPRPHVVALAGDGGAGKSPL
jgi:hypothetical protein